MMHRKFRSAAQLICIGLGCTPILIQAQAAGIWEIRGIPGQTCNLVTGYGPEDGSNGRHGFRLLVTKAHPDDVVLALTFTPDEVAAMALPPLESEVPVHLTFFNPDLGNAGMNLSMIVKKDQDPNGVRDLVGGLDPLGQKFLRQYQTLDIYVGDSPSRVRRISLVNSSRGLDGLNSCVKQTLRQG